MSVYLKKSLSILCSVKQHDNDICQESRTTSCIQIGFVAPVKDVNAVPISISLFICGRPPRKKVLRTMFPSSMSPHLSPIPMMRGKGTICLRGGQLLIARRAYINSFGSDRTALFACAKKTPWGILEGTKNYKQTNQSGIGAAIGTLRAMLCYLFHFFSNLTPVLGQSQYSPAEDE